MRQRSDTAPRATRRILLAVTGLSPQIITETLYALAVERDPPWVPAEVHLLTTTEGAQRARLALLSEQPGWFHCLRRDYGLPEIRFDADHIHVLPDAAGAPLNDIRTPQDNERAADFITERVRELTRQDTELHVSIAGGRKTMGYYLGYALSLFGRPGDRLSHVLISEPFESSWEFFYPTPYSRVIKTRDEKLVDTADATVTLAEIPFLSVRAGLPPRLLNGTTSFSQAVDAARRALAPPSLVIDLAGRRILAGGEPVPMTLADLAFHTLFARRRVEGAGPMQRGDGDAGPAYLDLYQRIAGDQADIPEPVRFALRNGMDESYFDQRKSKTNRALRDALGPQLAEPYLIHPEGRRSGQFALRLGAEAIRFGRIET